MERSKDASGLVLNGQNCVGFRGWFRVCAQWIAHAVGSPWAFVVAVLSIAAWAVTGPIFHFSDTWQLVINTATAIVTFLMVFLDPKHPEPGHKSLALETR
jgi:hypothetical protein